MEDKTKHLHLVEADPFDPAALRLDQSFTEGASVKKLLTTIPVRRPSAQDFFRVHPDETYRLDVPVIALKEDRETYLVAPSLVAELRDECIAVTLFTVMNRQGVLSLWPVRVLSIDGKTNAWWTTAREAAEKAMTAWLRIKANMRLGAYEMSLALGAIPDPAWPELTFKELLRIAFRDCFVDNPDHAVVKRLRGQV
jgi:hypothetical protein